MIGYVVTVSSPEEFVGLWWGGFQVTEKRYMWFHGILKSVFVCGGEGGGHSVPPGILCDAGCLARDFILTLDIYLHPY